MKLSQTLKDQMLIAIAGILAYVVSIFNDFHADDWRALAVMKDGFAWHKLFIFDDPYRLRPLTSVFLYLRYAAFGSRPLAYYVVDILMHLIVCLILYHLLKKIGFSRLAAFLSALIFAIYFQHYEDVIYIYGITRLIVGMFWLLSLMALYNYLKAGSGLSFIIFSLLSFLGLFSCEEFLIAPIGFIAFVFLLTEKQKLRNRLLSVVTINLAGLLVYALIRQSFIPHSFDHNDSYYLGFHVFGKLAEYLGWMIIPSPDHIYFSDFAHQMGLSVYWIWKLIYLFSTIVIISVMIYLLIKSPKMIKFFVLFVPLTLLCVLPFTSKVSSRYIYVPSIGLSTIAGYYLNELLQRLERGSLKRNIVLISMMIFATINISAIAATSRIYHQTQAVVRSMVEDVRNSKVDLNKFQFVLLDHLPGRAAPGPAFLYYFASNEIVASNDAMFGPIDIPKAAADLAAQGKTFIVFDYQNGHLREATRQYVP